MSPECRRELQLFGRRASSLGVTGLVLPLLYVDVPALRDANSQDDLVRLVSTLNHENWRELRFSQPKSEAYRRAVVRLAERLVEANRHAEAMTPTGAASERALARPEHESGGFVNQLDALAQALPGLFDTLDATGAEVERVGEIMQGLSHEMDPSDRRATENAARNVAREFGQPSERIQQLSNDFSAQLYGVDGGLQVVGRTCKRGDGA